MKIKKTLLSGLLLMGCLFASAQDQQPKTEYVFNPHFYVQLQGGGQYTLGEIAFDKLISPNAQFAIGYNFTPLFGARLNVNAWQSKGGWNGSNVGNVVAYDDPSWKYKYIAPALDITYNLSNAVAGFNPNRLFNLGVFAGIGVNFAWDNDEAAEVNNIIKVDYQSTQAAGRPSYADQNLRYLWDGSKARVFGQFGVTGDFRITDNLSAGIELAANVITDRYNSKKAGNADWYFNGLVGVKYAFGKTYTTRTVAPQAPVERVIERVIEKVASAERPAAPKTAAAQVQAEKIEPLRRDIFFTIRSFTIVPDEMVKVKEIADYLAKYPNATVTVTGYADKGTGNPTINKSYSEKRAKAVVDALVNKYGVARSRIVSDSKGDTEQPFAEQVKNRVSICIAQ